MIITSNNSILTNKTSNNLFSKLQAIKHKLATMMLALVFLALLSPCCFAASLISSDTPTVGQIVSDIKNAMGIIHKAIEDEITSTVASEIADNGSKINAGIADQIKHDGASASGGVSAKNASPIHKAIAAAIQKDPIAGALASNSIPTAVDARIKAIISEDTVTQVTTNKIAIATHDTKIKNLEQLHPSGLVSKPSTTAVGGTIATQNQKIAEDILPATKPKQIVAKVTQHIQVTALNAEAQKKFPNKVDKQKDYLMPDSSNSKVIASNQVGNHVITHVNNRIANRSPVSPMSRLITGVSSGVIDNNLQIWTSAGYQQTKEKEQSDTDYSKIEAMVVSLGVDTDVDDHATLGISYANVKSKVNSYGPAKGDKANDDIKTNAVTVYLAITENVKRSSLAIIYAHNKHDGKDGNKNIDTHNSNVVGANYAFNYSFNQHKQNSNASLMPEIILSSQLAVMSIKVNEHQNKYTGTKQPNKTPKQQNVIFNFGVGTTIITQQQLRDNIQLIARLKIGYNYIISSGDNSQEIELAVNNPASRVKVKAKEPSANNLNVGLNLDFIMCHNMHLDLDLQYTHGESAQVYGASLILRYVF